MKPTRHARVRHRFAAIATIVSGLTPLVLLTGPTPAHAAIDPGHPDFDGDGIADWAVGAAGENNGAGGVYTFYGADPKTTARTQYWTQDTPGIQGTSHVDDAFGAAVVAADFNNDGFSDLAIGVPGERVGGRRNAGGVQVIYGSVTGLQPAGNEFWTQDRGAIQSRSEVNELFGTSLAAGDFDADGRSDLAVGAPGELVGRAPGAGAAFVLRGCACGLTDAKSQRFTQDVSGMPGTAGRDDNFGFSLAVGTFGGDAIDDLAIGVPGDRVSNRVGAGGVHVLRGRATAGLTANGGQFWNEPLLQLPETNGAEEYDFFGFSIAAGDLNLDGVDDIAVGAPGEYSGSIPFSGAVMTIFGDGSMLGRAGAQYLSQDTPDMPGKNTKFQEFGHTVHVAPIGNVDGGVADDFLVIGVPYEDINGVADAGLVHVLPPSVSGVVASGSAMWHLDSNGLAGDPTIGGWFGITLGSVDTDADGQSELLVGSPGEDVGDVLGAGGVTRFGDEGAEPTASGSFHRTEASDVVSGRAARTDFFASALTSG